MTTYKVTGSLTDGRNYKFLIGAENERVALSVAMNRLVRSWLSPVVMTVSEAASEELIQVEGATVGNFFQIIDKKEARG